MMIQYRFLVIGLRDSRQRDQGQVPRTGRTVGVENKRTFVVSSPGMHRQ
jgi:hypothetical protein